MYEKINSKYISIILLISFLFTMSTICPISGLSSDSLLIAQSFSLDGSLSIRSAYSHISFVPETNASAPVLTGRYDRSNVFYVDDIPEGVNCTHTSGKKFTVANGANDFAFETYIYYDGDARPAINAMWDDTAGASVLFAVDSDGYCMYNNGGTTTKSNVYLEKGKWHKVSIFYENQRLRFTIKINGITLTNMTYMYNSSWASSLWFGVSSASGKGMVAYDDFIGYHNGYVPPENEDSVSVLSDISIITSTSGDKVAVKAEQFPVDSYLVAVASYEGNMLKEVDTHISTKDDAPFVGVKIGTDYTYKIFAWESGKLTPLDSSVTFNNDTLSTKERIGTYVMMNADFEENNPLNLYHNYGNIIERRKDSDGNTVMYVQRQNTGDFHMSATAVEPYDSEYTVYEFDFKVLDEKSVFNYVFKDEYGNVCNFASLSPGLKFYYANCVENLQKNTWYRFSVVVNTKDRSVDYYFKGKKRDTQRLYDSFAPDGIISLARIHVTIYTAGGTASASDPVEFMIDNFRIYEGKKPQKEVGETIEEVRYNGRSIFPSDSPERSLLKNSYAIHKRSSVVYDGENKTIMKNGVYEAEGKTWVDANELDSILNEESGLSGRVTIETYADAIAREVTIADSKVNSGLIVLSKSGFDIPQDEEELQKLNDFIFNLRPDSDYVLKTYEQSPLYGVHPRIQASRADFQRIWDSYDYDKNIQYWSSSVIQSANRLLGKAPLEYELTDGVRLLSVSREMLSRMYTLGFAYQFSGNQKYVEQAWIDLEAVCTKFYDWHPVHDIDLGEMAAAVAIGYDWMYHGLTPERRSLIEKGIYRKALSEATWGFQSFNSPTGSYSLLADNHNVVTNGGIAMLSLAFMDVYPEECAHLVSNAVRAVEHMLPSFAPDGAWFEGPHYWEYTMQYTSKMLSSMDTALGTDFNLSLGEGLPTSGEFMMYLQSSTGIYNYGDGIQTRVYPAEILWLAKKYNNPGIGKKLLEITGAYFDDSEGRVLAMIFNTSSDSQATELSIDKLYEGENVLVMRKNWENDGSAFVGIHAGETNIAHSQLDGGSFIYDYGNIRWAKDLGMNGYNVQGYWDADGDDAKRWTYFRSRAESHNTIVVNPGSLSDHITDSFAKLTVVKANDNSAIATVDMTELLRDVNSAKRGFFFTDDRTSLVIRDEITLTKTSDVYWFMITDAEVTITENGAVLTQGGKTLNLEFASDVSAEISSDIAKPLSTSPNPDGNSEETAKRIAIKLTGNGNVNLTVKLTPQDVEGTPVSNYHKPISEW